MFKKEHKPLFKDYCKINYNFITYVNVILDEHPKGPKHNWGGGVTSNHACALECSLFTPV
jgi:hypothetical protein